MNRVEKKKKRRELTVERNMIEAKELGISFGDKKVLDNITFEVKKMKSLAFWDQVVPVKQRRSRFLQSS